MNAQRPLAVVTGASRGIGLELAGVLAAHGHDLILNAEDHEDAAAGAAAAPGAAGGSGNTSLDLATATVRAGGADAEAVPADLATYDGVEKLCAAVRATGRPVDVLVLNAGVGQGGAFLDTELADQARVIDLNVSGTVHLAHRLLPGMVERGAGRVLITSSVASTMPGSFQSVYNASKSFLQSFAQALAEELRGTGVTVTSLMPGPTDTDFFRRAGMADTPLGRAPKDDPRLVARQGYQALMAGRGKVIAGSPATRLQGAAGAVLPDRVKAAAHRLVAKPTRRRREHAG
ncbi:SDR family oxidoreductase [Streptomyces sp. JJ36]|uniref:SDR family NAD(P)-dependent oxidoreductase n=1 Tax=Streptomyces sp. JJ36 TaxID=2736645 RepID=UPI001F180E11|nr:SDR family NAD(P)-dependent oxidoreductase [Streptomyces sp. JJ36]MCF6521995.1 SDR family NAD(P)-dependent oxidoreductase [Streptomyces sp. JJ36]